MRLSIAMATYNGEQFIREQLTSLARQTRQPDELVVSDDGSTDSTLQIIQDFSRSAPFPVRLFRSDRNLGFTLNFLLAAERCSGELLAFCDQDDAWLPHKLGRAAEVFADDDVVLLIHSAEVIDESGRALGRRHPKIARSMKQRGWEDSPIAVLPPGFSMVAKRCVVDELLSAWPMSLYEELRERQGNLFGHDMLLFLIAGDLGHVYYEAEALGYFRVHGRNTTAPRSTFESWPVRVRLGLAQSCAVSPEDYRRLAERCRAEHELLVALCKRRKFPSLERLEANRNRAARALALRAELYQAGWTQYWARYAQMLAQGSYMRRDHGGLGLPSALKDAALGWLMSVELRRRVMGWPAENAAGFRGW